MSQQTELLQLEETAQLKIKLFMLICRRKIVSGQQVLLEKEHCEGQRVVHIPGYTELSVCEGLLSPRRAWMHSGKQNRAYFGTIPRTRLFLGVLISSAQWEEKNILKAREGEGGAPPKKTRDGIKKRKSRKGRMISSSTAESTLTDKHFSALSSQDLVTIVTMLLYWQCLLTQCSELCNIH